MNQPKNIFVLNTSLRIKYSVVTTMLYLVKDFI